MYPFWSLLSCPGTDSLVPGHRVSWPPDRLAWRHYRLELNQSLSLLRRAVSAARLRLLSGSSFWGGAMRTVIKPKDNESIHVVTARANAPQTCFHLYVFPVLLGLLNKFFRGTYKLYKL